MPPVHPIEIRLALPSDFGSEEMNDDPQMEDYEFSQEFGWAVGSDLIYPIEPAAHFACFLLVAKTRGELPYPQASSNSSTIRLMKNPERACRLKCSKARSPD